MPSLVQITVVIPQHTQKFQSLFLVNVSNDALYYETMHWLYQLHIMHLLCIAWKRFEAQKVPSNESFMHTRLSILRWYDDMSASLIHQIGLVLPFSEWLASSSPKDQKHFASEITYSTICTLMSSAGTCLMWNIFGTISDIILNSHRLKIQRVSRYTDDDMTKRR